MLQKVRMQVRKFHMLRPGDRVLVGVSGGADSICLLQALFLLREEYSIEIAACHCHHMLRGEEADEDASFVREFCEQRGILYFYSEEDVAGLAKKEGLSLEEAGRQFRYGIFLSLMECHGFHKLAVAHNANDRAETVLFHLARGTGLFGLCTMEPVRAFGTGREQSFSGEKEGKYIIRPLLEAGRDEIERWLLEQGISWRTDSTNLSDLYTRNRIRRHILPQLCALNGQAVAHMGNAAQAIGEAVDFLKSLQRGAEKECRIKETGKEEIKIRLDKLMGYHDYLKKALLHQFLGEISGTAKDLSRVHVELLQDLAEGRSGRKLSLPGGITARKEYGLLILSGRGKETFAVPEKGDGPDGFLEGEEGKERWELFSPGGEYKAVLEKIPKEECEISKKKYTKFFDCDKMKNELCLRFWQPGDYIYLREDGGKKKLGRYFIDEKVPQGRRGQILLLADGSHIVWIAGYRISGYYKVTDKTTNILSAAIKQRRKS